MLKISKRTGKPLKKPGPKMFYGEKMKRYPIRLPLVQIAWLKRDGRNASHQLRSLVRTVEGLRKGGRWSPGKDPGKKGGAGRATFTLPQCHVELAAKYGRGKGHAVGFRRIIGAAMRGGIDTALLDE